MLKPMLAITTTGIVALLLWRALAVLLFPLVGIALGVVITILKVILLAGVVFLSIWLIRRLDRSTSPTG
jgi:hypothetical protein